MRNKITFNNPPASRGRQSKKHAALAAEIRRQPDTWALVATCLGVVEAAVLSRDLRRQHLAVTQRKIAENGISLWAKSLTAISRHEIRPPADPATRPGLLVAKSLIDAELAR